MAKEQREYLSAKLKLVPNLPGVYIMKDAKQQVIYVGKAIKLKNRLRCYFGDHAQVPQIKVAAMIKKIADFEYLVCANEQEALILEANLIKRYQPFYNILLKDDHDYPYLKISSDQPWPRVQKAYRIGSDKAAGAKYYGPYTYGNLSRALKTLEQLFPLATCDPKKVKVGKSPCINYQLGKCLGTCANLATAKDYLKVLEQVTAYLEGDTQALESELQTKMLGAAQQQNFEQAAFWRDRLQALQALGTTQRIVSDKKINVDVIGFAKSAYLYCLQKLEIRGGKIVGSACFFVEPAALAWTLYDENLSVSSERGEAKEEQANFLDLQEIQEARETREVREVREAREDKEDREPQLVAAQFTSELTEVETKALLQVLCTQNYSSLAYLPPLIVLASPLEEHARGVLETYLSELAKHKVKLSEAKRGDKLAWAKLARQNAEEALVKKNLLVGSQTTAVKSALMSLSNYCKLAKIPERIEAYDVANLGNDYLCCAMAVFCNGVYTKSQSCLFKIRDQEEQDDYAALSQALVRRMRYLCVSEGSNVDNAGNAYKVASEASLFQAKQVSSLKTQPDLILLDGGKGHLHAVLQALERNYKWSESPLSKKLKIAGMVKNERHETRALLCPDERVVELAKLLKPQANVNLQVSEKPQANAKPQVNVKAQANAKPPQEKQTEAAASDLDLLRFLTSVQNEVHRLANNYYRKLQKQKILHYELEDIPGIGPKKRQKIMQYFKQLAAVKAASLSDLMAAGLNQSDALAVYNYCQLHKK